MNPALKLTLRATLCALALGPVSGAQHGLPPVVDGAAIVTSKLGEQADLSGTFVDERGNPVALRDLASSERPTLLNLGFYNCPGVCSTVLNSLLEKLDDSDLEPGRDFNLVTLSFDHKEGHELAFQKRQTYVGVVRDEHEGVTPAWTESWHFLTGGEDAIRALTESLGWGFRYDERSGVNHDHPPVVVILTKDGRISRYLDTRESGAKDFRRAMIEASDGEVGTFLERIWVTCMTFDPTTHRYSVTAMTIMQIGGVVFLAALSSFLLVLWRRERAKKTEAVPAH